LYAVKPGSQMTRACATMQRTLPLVPQVGMLR